jgi:hypothetical protein
VTKREMKKRTMRVRVRVRVRMMIGVVWVASNAHQDGDLLFVVVCLIQPDCSYLD